MNQQQFRWLLLASTGVALTAPQTWFAALSASRNLTAGMRMMTPGIIIHKCIL